MGKYVGQNLQSKSCPRNRRRFHILPEYVNFRALMSVFVCVDNLSIHQVIIQLRGVFCYQGKKQISAYFLSVL